MSLEELNNKNINLLKKLDKMDKKNKSQSIQKSTNSIIKEGEKPLVMLNNMITNS